MGMRTGCNHRTIRNILALKGSIVPDKFLFKGLVAASEVRKIVFLDQQNHDSERNNAAAKVNTACQNT